MRQPPLRILSVSAEVAPYSKTGGLGDVASALPKALHQPDDENYPIQVTTLTPLYRCVVDVLKKRQEQVRDTGVRVSAELGDRVYQGKIMQLVQVQGPRLLFLHCPSLYDRDGIYDDPEQKRQHGDNPIRFMFLCHAAMQLGQHLPEGVPDILHTHDWQTALLPLLKKFYNHSAWSHTKTVYTIHNLAYQGVFSPEWLPKLRLPMWLMQMDMLEYFGAMNCMKAGIRFADAVTTVSPSYAKEIQASQFGEGLDTFISAWAPETRGILNGIDTTEWNPEKDKQIERTYSLKNFEGKFINRKVLAQRFGLRAGPGDPIFGIVSRFAHQKGLDIVADLIPELVTTGSRIVILGSGDPKLEERFEALGKRFPKHVGVKVGFDAQLAHQIEAGADAFVMPSRYEPCGLNQMYSMRYGTIPIVHRVGGLRDTVTDTMETTARHGLATGFRFDVCDGDGLRWGLTRAVKTYRQDPRLWHQLRMTGMQQDFSWNRSAGEYLALYLQLLGRE